MGCWLWEKLLTFIERGLGNKETFYSQFLKLLSVARSEWRVQRYRIGYLPQKTVTCIPSDNRGSEEEPEGDPPVCFDSHWMALRRILAERVGCRRNAR